MFRLTLKLSQLSRQAENRSGTCSTSNIPNIGRTRGFRVAVVGAAGAVGQPLTLLLKMNTQITSLVLHDVVPLKGVAVDLSHISTSPSVEAFEGMHQLEWALDSASIVVMCAAVPTKPKLSLFQEFSGNSNIAIDVARAVSVACPNAFLAIITNPLNIIVPIVARILKKEDAYDPKRLFGVTALDVVRAKTFLGKIIDVDPMQVSVPVIGGHSPDTILPVISHSYPVFDRSLSVRETLQNRIRNAELDLVQTMTSEGKCERSSALAMAYATAHFVKALLDALNGGKNIIEYAYVQSDVTEAKFFASPVKLGPEGISTYLELPQLAQDEECDFDSLIKRLKIQINTAFRFPIR